MSGLLVDLRNASGATGPPSLSQELGALHPAQMGVCVARQQPRRALQPDIAAVEVLGRVILQQSHRTERQRASSVRLPGTQQALDPSRADSDLKTVPVGGPPFARLDAAVFPDRVTQSKRRVPAATCNHRRSNTLRLQTGAEPIVDPHPARHARRDAA